MLAVTGLGYRVSPEFSLRDISFDVRAGEGVAIIGSNGAGKTTVIRLIAGLLKPQYGEVLVCGISSRRWGKVGSHLGYVQQSKELPDGTTVEAYVKHQLRLHRAPAERYDELIELAELQPYVQQSVRTLSGGSQRKLHLICAVAHRPDLLILDEPTTGLDPSAQEALLKLLADLKAGGVGVLFASHHRHELEALADSAVVLHRGRQVEEASLGDILRRGAEARLSLATYPGLHDAEAVRRWSEEVRRTYPAVEALEETPTGVELRLRAGEHPALLGELVALAHAQGIALRSAGFSLATLADIVRSIAETAEGEKLP